MPLRQRRWRGTDPQRRVLVCMLASILCSACVSMGGAPPPYFVAGEITPEHFDFHVEGPAHRSGEQAGRMAGGLCPCADAQLQDRTECRLSFPARCTHRCRE